MPSRAIAQLTLTKVRELVREPEALFWVFVFPILLAVALGIAFRARPPEKIPVGVTRAEGAESCRVALAASPDLTAEIVDTEEARHLLRTGKLALVVVPDDEMTYWYDPTRPDSRIARLAADEALQRAAGRADVYATAERTVTERGSRYIDFVVPGLLGMNLMGTGMWGIGFSIVDARSKRLLKRLVATPMRRTDYLLSQILGRLVFLIVEAGLLIGFAAWFLEVPVRGSIAALAGVCLLGAMTFAGLGLLVASRPRTIEGVSGLMNFVMLPMWICSGIFFSTSRFPDALQPFVQALPLTAVNDALRAVMLEGAGLASIGGELAIAAAWAAVSFAVALVGFRWT